MKKFLIQLCRISLQAFLPKGQFLMLTNKDYVSFDITNTDGNAGDAFLFMWKSMNDYLEVQRKLAIIKNQIVNSTAISREGGTA